MNTEIEKGLEALAYIEKLEQQIKELKGINELMREYVRLLPDDLYSEYLEKLNKH